MRHLKKFESLIFESDNIADYVTDICQDLIKDNRDDIEFTSKYDKKHIVVTFKLIERDFFDEKKDIWVDISNYVDRIIEYLKTENWYPCFISIMGDNYNNWFYDPIELISKLNKNEQNVHFFRIYFKEK